MNMETLKPKLKAGGDARPNALVTKNRLTNHTRAIMSLDPPAFCMNGLISPSLKSCSWKWNTSSVIWGGNNIIIDLFPWGSFTEVNDVQRQELHYPRFPVKLIPSRRVRRSRFAWEVKKWLLTASNPDEEKEKKPRQTFPGSAAPTWKGFNVTSLPAPALSDVERPASALFSLQPSTLLVCWSSRLTRCDLTPLDFHTGGKLPSCLTTSMFIDPVLPLPRGPGSHTRFYFPLS